MTAVAGEAGRGSTAGGVGVERGAPGAPRKTPPKIPRPSPAPRTASPVIARLCARLAEAAEGPGDGADRVASVVDEFWRAHPRTPIVEPTDRAHEFIVTFLWRDRDAADVLLFANRMTDERNLSSSLMERVAGTDVWWLAYRMRSDWRASYSFLVRRDGERAPWHTDDDQAALRAALDHGRVDLRNPDEVRGRRGIWHSVVALPDAPAQPWLDVAATEPSACVTGPDGRRLWMYAPADAADDEALPLVIVLDGEVWRDHHGLPGVVDAMIAAGRMRRARVALVDSGGVAQRWRDLDADGGGAAWLAERLVPWLRAQHAIAEEADGIVVTGQSLGGSTALQAALAYPHIIGAVLAQSASTWQSDLSVLARARDRGGMRVWLEVGSHEWVLRDGHRDLAAALRASGADVEYREFNGGHDYACWRGGIADGLAALLPPRV